MAQTLSATKSSSSARCAATSFERNLHTTSFCVIAMFVGAFALREAFALFAGQLQSGQRSLWWPIPLWLDAILMVTLFPLVEEFVFRGLLIRWLQRFGFVIAAAVSTVLFAAIHLPNTLHGWIYFAMIGALLCVVRYATGSVWSCVAAHAAYNAVPAAFILFFVIKW